MNSMKHTKTSCKTRIIALLLCVGMLLPLSACGEKKPVEQQIFAMDTLMDLKAYGKNAETGINDAVAVINGLNAMLDPELESSKVYAINHAQGDSVVVNGQIAKMIQTAQTVSQQTDGALDLTVYPLLRAWGFIDADYRVPDDATIEALLEGVDMTQVTLTAMGDDGSYLVSVPAGTELSFGAVAKGCASNYAINAMRAAGVTSGVISLGGNVQTLGTKPDGSDWNVAVQNPNDTGDYIGYVSVGETAVITSGSYQRYFMQNGRLYHHIIDPATGEPAENKLQSVTIVCPDGILADCLSTAMFVLGETDALAYWRDHGGFEMILITTDGRVVLTNGLYGKFTPNGDRYEYSYVK